MSPDHPLATLTAGQAVAESTTVSCPHCHTEHAIQGPVPLDTTVECLHCAKQFLLEPAIHNRQLLVRICSGDDPDEPPPARKRLSERDINAATGAIEARRQSVADHNRTRQIALWLGFLTSLVFVAGIFGSLGYTSGTAAANAQLQDRYAAWPSPEVALAGLGPYERKGNSFVATPCPVVNVFYEDDGNVFFDMRQPDFGTDFSTDLRQQEAADALNTLLRNMCPGWDGASLSLVFNAKHIMYLFNGPVFITSAPSPDGHWIIRFSHRKNHDPYAPPPNFGLTPSRHLTPDH